MKKILFAVMLVAVLSMIASAADVKTQLSDGKYKGVENHQGPGWGSPGPNAAKLIFYGGNFNSSSEYANGYANGNTLLVPSTTTYGAVTAPKGKKVVATGVLFNDLATQTGTIFDPATGTYDVRTGVSEGVGGKSVASGSGSQTSAPTGRSGFGFDEYSTSVSFTKALTPTGGTTYFVNESPQCTDSSNEICSELQYFASNTDQTGGINATYQPEYEDFFNSSYFGYTWASTCDLVGGQSGYCQYQSFGIY